MRCDSASTSQLQLWEDGVDVPVRASARRVSEPRPCRDGLDTGPDHGQAARRRQAHDGGVLHHVQRQAGDGEEPGRFVVRCPSFELFRTASSRRRRRRETTPPWRRRRDAVATIPRAGMGKIPNYFKSAQKELLSLGGKLIDKMKDYDKDNIPTKVRARGVPAGPSLCRCDSY